MARKVIRIGRSRVTSCLSHGLPDRQALGDQPVGEVDEQDAVGHDDPNHEDDPEARLHVERRVGGVEREHDPDQALRHDEQNDQRIDE